MIGYLQSDWVRVIVLVFAVVVVVLAVVQMFRRGR